MGLLEPADWRASWITGDYVPDKKKRYPWICLKRNFLWTLPPRCGRPGCM